MRKVLLAMAVIVSAATAQAGIINVYEPDAGGGGSWLIVGGSNVSVNSVTDESIDFNIDMSAAAAQTQDTTGILFTIGSSAGVNLLDDQMDVFQSEGSATVRVVINSYDGGAVIAVAGNLEQPGLNTMVNVPLAGGGQETFNLQSVTAAVPAPSSFAMLLSGIGGLGLMGVIRRRK